MAIPDFQSCMRPLLDAIKDGQTYHFLNAFESVCDFFELTDEERAAKLPSGKQTVIKNRVSWSRTFLKKAGLLTQPQRGHVQITPLGLKALEDCPKRIDVKYLKQFESFLEFHTAKPSEPSLPDKIENDENTDPTERLEKAHGEIQKELVAELLENIKQQTPQFLENLVVELMQAMGYGGWSKESGSATQYTSDGGVDGLINEDPLGLETIYLQAKRYTTGSPIGRPDIQAFVGALEMKRSRKGVFITTSRFSNEAQDYISKIQKKVILIDGQQLAELMVKHGLGVSTKETYQVKAIDTDYFTDD